MHILFIITVSHLCDNLSACGNFAGKRKFSRRFRTRTEFRLNRNKEREGKKVKCEYDKRHDKWIGKLMNVRIRD